MHLSLAEAETLVVAALRRSKVSDANARSVAVALVAAEAAGQSGHGLRRVPAYAGQAKVGKVDGFAQPQLSRPSPAVLRIDAGNGYAYPALDLAVAELPAVAREQGIALAAISRSHHAGVMGLTVERFADQGLVALMVANAPASMAPWGGKTPVFGTNPIAFAAPLPGDEPVVIDLALSKVARGKVMAARQQGASIPADWAFDREGRPTTDAEEALAGTMVPAGDAKGAALAFMVEILAAGLTGANYAFEASSLFDDKGAPPALGHTIIAINPEATSAGDTAQRLALLAGEITRDPNVRLPGRRGQSARHLALTEGVTVEDEVIAAIERL
ncbi:MULTISPECIES: Ldh family oxidoreductase [Rhizobium]|uniref:(2R)-3-sulfolactate dehydrogenase (NADP+) n=1 Tax=Rhizobium tropici TaxID=398 RepID=A0A6P1C0P0_RHITR|nr:MULTISPECIES: Ldh family oxidoreductase [Rhizobium]AGB72851.1 malate/L-lactate dehydrogenase subfamily [Rhizobium tropici CIAT 899]MBB4241148.1 (2R)-3-sulfolactate dehydrogenase (NADP+) [Rhizobium tropici]MBB5592306.1 (2R)-3-sulfolactate dehydrogenase (NADP+) [Rhizobium tropici]MBB6491473.1 (2R)-3-sulfolactate dehydrogenase (NADP+) [Rhizobium tropici]NEV10478.1 Ldh family oxidoreductase [Rhizobium tropici]